MSLQILDVNSEDVKACAVFKYKGYEISCSNICKPSSILIMKDCKEVHYTNTVEQAIDYVNEVLLK